MSTLGATNISKLHLHVPPSGSWMADVLLLERPAPSGLVTLTVGDLKLVGSVLPGRGGEDSPERPHLVVMGGAGWRSLIPRAGSYRAAGGVRLLTVLQDLAGLAAEPYDAPSDTTLGTAFSWDASSSAAPLRLRWVLSHLVAIGVLPTWRVAPTGRTRFDAWPSIGEASKLATITHRDLAHGMRRCALDNAVAAFLPGATVEGVRVARTIITETPGKLTAEVYES